MRQLWMRAGINLNLSAEEADAILAPGASAEAIEQTVKKIILEGRFSFSGESYIPQPCVEQYNDAYGTKYKADDIDFEVNIDAETKQNSGEADKEARKSFRKKRRQGICPICGTELDLDEMECNPNGVKVSMSNSLIVEVEGGYFRADPAFDPNYPGIDVEFIADNEPDDAMSRPRVLFEKPIGEGLSVLIWNNPNSEDCEEEIEFSTMECNKDGAEDDVAEDCDGECVGCDRACADRIEV